MKNNIAAVPQKSILPSDSSLMQSAMKWAIFLGVTVIIIAGFVLIGWQFNIEFFKRPLPRLTAMNPVTAFLFVLSGTAFLLLNNEKNSVKKKIAGHVITWLIIITALLRLIAVTAGINIPVDHFLFSEKMIAD